jgi:hypothetical protein
VVSDGRVVIVVNVPPTAALRTIDLADGRLIAPTLDSETAAYGFISIVDDEFYFKVLDWSTGRSEGRAEHVEATTIPPAAARTAAAAVATGDGIVAWDLDPASWELAACRLAGRNLTRGEWDRYLGDLAPYRATCDDEV